MKTTLRFWLVATLLSISLASCGEDGSASDSSMAGSTSGGTTSDGTGGADPTDGKGGDSSSSGGEGNPAGGGESDGGSTSGGTASTGGSTADGGVPSDGGSDGAGGERASGGGGNTWPIGGDGWTDLTPVADSRIVYVSSSEGDDDNDGLSESEPVETLQKGVSLLRDGSPDHLLLRQGDTWTDESLGRFLSGRSADEPMVISSYGDSGERPVVRVSRPFIDHNGQARSNFAVVGLSLVAYKMDPDDPAFTGEDESPLRFVGGGENILIEDCRLRFIEVIIQSFDGMYDNVTLRRNMILDAYSLGTTTSNDRRPSGLYLDTVANVTIEENVFDHNGWNEDVPSAGANMYNHNVYIQYTNLARDIVFRKNIVTRASSHGVHGRPGGLYENNLFVENSIGLQMGYAGHTLPSDAFATAFENVILSGKRMDPDDSNEPRTAAVWGLNLDDLGDADVTIERNVVAHRRDDGANSGISNASSATYVDNIQYEWGGGIGDMDDPGWTDPDRNVGSYNSMLGGEESLEAFLTVVRNRPLQAWDPQYSAPAVNDYIREGFDLD